jgi:hypothetical protein
MYFIRTPDFGKQTILIRRMQLLAELFFKNRCIKKNPPLKLLTHFYFQRQYRIQTPEFFGKFFEGHYRHKKTPLRRGRKGP